MNKFDRSYNFDLKLFLHCKTEYDISVLIQVQAQLPCLAIQSKSTPSMTVLDSESYGTCQISIIEYSELDVNWMRPVDQVMIF